MASTDAATRLEKLGFKCYATSDVDLTPAIPVFHRWIQTNRVEGLLIDVADYRHVPDGPGVVLIGHEADISLDRAEGPLGLLYLRKRLGQGTGAERLRAALVATLVACQALEQEIELRDAGLRFDASRLRFITNDRLATPNDDATHAAITPDLTRVLSAACDGTPTIERDLRDPRSRFALNIRTSGPTDAQTLLERLT